MGVWDFDMAGCLGSSAQFLVKSMSEHTLLRTFPVYECSCGRMFDYQSEFEEHQNPKLFEAKPYCWICGHEDELREVDGARVCFRCVPEEVWNAAKPAVEAA